MWLFFSPLIFLSTHKFLSPFGFEWRERLGKPFSKSPRILDDHWALFFARMKKVAYFFSSWLSLLLFSPKNLLPVKPFNLWQNLYFLLLYFSINIVFDGCSLVCNGLFGTSSKVRSVIGKSALGKFLGIKRMVKSKIGHRVKYDRGK